MEMEGRVYSEFYRNTSEEIFMKTLMESSVGIPAAPTTMKILGFKNISNSFRADNEELFKNWLTTGESRGHSSSSMVHNHPRQLSRMLKDQTTFPSHLNGVPPQTKRSNENPTPQSPFAVGETACDIHESSFRISAERGYQASNLHLVKAWFSSPQPVTRSGSSELRRKYIRMQNSQTAIGIDAMHIASGLAVNQFEHDFVNPRAFNEASVCDISSPFDDFKASSNSSPSTFDAPHIDKVSSIVSMLKSSLERKKLGNHVEKETVLDSSLADCYSNLNHRETFHDLTTTKINDLVLIQRLQGALDADLEGFQAPTNLMNIVSRETSQSESSAAAPVNSNGFDVSEGPSNSGQSPSVFQNLIKQAENGKSSIVPFLKITVQVDMEKGADRAMGVFSKGQNGSDTKEHMYDNLKEDYQHNGSSTRHGLVTLATTGDRGDPTKKHGVERSRKMAEAKERTQTPPTSTDVKAILKRCENLEKEVRSLKLNLAFMNRKDSEQTKQIEELQKQNEDMGDEKERLLEEIDRILSRPNKI